jgi:hypothetical protein
MRYEFICQHSSDDTLTLELQPDGDLRLAVKDGTDNITVAFYVKPEDMGPFARAVASLSAHRRRRNPAPTDPPVVPLFAANLSPDVVLTPVGESPVDPRTPEQVEADEWESKRQRRAAQGNPVTFAEAMLPQPGTVDAERAYIRATEMLGNESSVTSRVELARFLAGQGRWG